MRSHESSEKRTHHERTPKPTDRTAPDPDRALVPKQGASLDVLEEKPILEEVERPFNPLESDFVRRVERHPLDGSIDLAPAPGGRDDRVKLHELPVALIAQHRR